MSTMSDAAARAMLATIERGWNAGSAPWNPSAITALYTDDALFFGGRPEHSVGRDGVLAYFESYVGVIETARMRLVDQHLAELAPGVVLAQGFVEFSFVLANGRASGSRMRATLVLVERDGRWRIRQHHFSSPPEAPPLGDD